MRSRYPGLARDRQPAEPEDQSRGPHGRSQGPGRVHQPDRGCVSRLEVIFRLRLGPPPVGAGNYFRSGITLGCRDGPYEMKG